MSLSHSPKVVTDGLVFYYDMSNTQKSWKGAPTTNLSINDTFYSNWANSGTGVWNSNDTAIERLHIDYPLLSVLVTATGNLHISCGRTTISAGLTYTVSVDCYIPSSAGVLAGSVPYIRTDPANTGRGTLSYNGNADWATWPRDRWIRITQTFTNTANDTALYISCYLNTLDNKIYMTAPTVENIDFMTPFVGGAGATRSNTQAIVDLTNKNTVTSTSLTYASDGSFSFDGTSNRLSQATPDLPTGTGNKTILTWVWPDSTGPANQYTGLVVYGGRSSSTPSDAVGLSLYTSGTTMYVSSAYWSNDFTPNNLPVTANSWNMVGMIARGAPTTNNTTLICGNASGVNYVTGSSSNYARGLSTTSVNLTIGCLDAAGGRYMKGKISQVMIFNRELSTDEISQMFNAHRGRYGI